MIQKLLYYLGRIWYSLTPKVVEIKEVNFQYEGETYMFLLEDGTLLRFEDFDSEEECFTFTDGSKYYPLLEVRYSTKDGERAIWDTQAFMRR